MTLPVLLCALWVLAATVVALLPMRMQYVPGIALLVVAPVLIVWLGLAQGPIWGILALAGFGSMFRHPLRYLWKRARGEKVEVPR